MYLGITISVVVFVIITFATIVALVKKCRKLSVENARLRMFKSNVEYSLRNCTGGRLSVKQAIRQIKRTVEKHDKDEGRTKIH